jgi:hypothetical protein
MAGSPPVSICRIELGDRKPLKKFIKFPWNIYRDDPNWVPPLIFDQLQFFTPGKNPYLSHSKAQLFMAFRGEGPVGRISAHENNQHIQVHRDGAGFFGFFECVNDQAVANALFDAASSWLRDRGLKTMRGPVSFSVNHEVGLLIDAFDEPPLIRMTYNPPYYADLIEGYGLQKIQDLYAYAMFEGKELPKRRGDLPCCGSSFCWCCCLMGAAAITGIPDGEAGGPGDRRDGPGRHVDCVPGRRIALSAAGSRGTRGRGVWQRLESRTLTLTRAAVSCG